MILWHRNNSTEKFCVWLNFTKPVENSNEHAISICTHGTIGYSRFVFDHVSFKKIQIYEKYIKLNSLIYEIQLQLKSIKIFKLSRIKINSN